MTKDELEAIRQRAEAATESYWAADDCEWPGNENLRYWVKTHWDGVAAAATKEDAEFIASARQDIPALLDHIAELASDIARMCPIADRPIVESLLAEKDHMAEEISDLRRKIDLYEAYAQEYDYYAILNEMGDENADDR
ncbi:hypothetical protein OIO07_20645 [Bacillus paralicheniformis]|jgi:hypothetical protein|uniref:hypothetical protein n=1 Tax=Bacillus paralicheniformis TaxID=1648923 RepID=UPI0008283EED|nr:hypothetical protein [Bacillus paralicheniformis]AYQ17729.1 hypothetical protein D5285_17530 [Bacillus paralicheniformis]MCV9370639.1 hypothetical protein [Bacillus paralicheniformis]MDI0243675.1 hypothetical protein [Bacillus paralicheniformis]MEC2328824.1 hypothetical protein [Bacillus paralicheniformis]MED0700352.1 hypothetical protein [Bacillus paralicheniformis]